MADDQPKLPPKQAAQAAKIEAAFDAFLEELRGLKKDRRNLKERYIKRVDQGKIEQIKKILQSL